MLQNEKIAGKTYTERFEEALSLIPLYSKEWTNFNPADPSITILEVLTMFETLQQNHIDDISSDVTAALLKMTGFEATKSRPARLLLKTSGIEADYELQQGQSFVLGDIQYETVTKKTLHNCRILSVYRKNQDEIKDISYILEPDVTLGTKVFGDEPVEGDGLYFICNSLPPKGEEMYFYAQCQKDNRNAFAPRQSELFATVEWEVYTRDGFVKLEAVDKTGGFLVSGEIRMKLKEEAEPALYEEFETKGYCIRGRLTKSNYDKLPRVVQFDGFLLEVWQRTTRSFSRTITKGNSIALKTDIADSHYLLIFMRRENEKSYHRCYQAPSEDAKGFYYDVEEKDDRYVFRFDKEKHGVGPDKGRDSIRLLAYDEETMRRYRLGEVLGYDNQIIKLPFESIVLDSFSILAKRVENGQEIFDFVKPGHREEGALYYSLSERDGSIRINNPGDFIGAELFMGACATNLGDKGNVIAGNKFFASGLPTNFEFRNPYDSTGGRFRESLASVRARFVNDIDIPFTTITAWDYETLVKNTPGLCIGKVKAIRDTTANQVKLAILPSTGGERPVLREDYRRYILDMVNQHRILCTKVSILNPEYVKVNVSATIYVKPHYEDVLPQLQKLINDKLDYINSDKQFGETFSYEALFRAIEGEPYVSFLYDLKIMLAKSNQGKVVDQDIVPVENGLIVPGNIKIETMINYGN